MCERAKHRVREVFFMANEISLITIIFTETVVAVYANGTQRIVSFA